MVRGRRLHAAAHTAHATHAAHAAAHAAGRAAGAAGAVVAVVVGAAALEVAGRDHVVDTKDHDGRLGGGLDGLGLDAERLHDALGLHVDHVARVGVETGAELAAVVAGAEVDQRVDGVETRVLGEGARDDFQRVGERLNGELLAAADGVGEVAEL